MYTDRNFKTKKQLKEAVVNGDKIRIYQPGGMFTPPEASSDYTGRAFLEGPHYPAAHTWYAEVAIKDGIITKVK